MDVPPCNPLFDLRLDAQVLSKTLNCSTNDKRKIIERRIQKAGHFIPAFFYILQSRQIAGKTLFQKVLSYRGETIY
jgi:hypothetical protein